MDGWPLAMREAVGLIGRGDPWLVGVVSRSVQVSLGATFCAALVGLPLAGALAGAPPGARRVLVPFVHIGAALPAVLIGMLVLLVAGRPGGVPWGLRTAVTVGAGQTVLGLFVVASLAEPVLREARERLLKTAWTLGARPAQAWRLLATEARAGLAAAVAAAFARLVGEAGAALLLGGSSVALGAAIVTQAGSDQWARAMALGIVLSVLALVASALVVRWREDGG